MEMPNGVITHHNRPPAHRATDRPTDTDESGDYTMCAAYLLACVFACLLLCSREAARAGRGCAERGRGTCLASITYPSFPPSLPPSLPPSHAPRSTFHMPHSLTPSPDSRTALHYVAVTATAEYDRCPIITGDATPSAFVRNSTH